MRLVLVDGNHLCYRAYFTKGVKDLATSEGAKVGVVYGFLRQFCSLLALNSRELNVLVVAWDSGGSNYRSCLYGAYKANRAELRAAEGFDSESFESQRQSIQYLLWVLGVRQLKIPGVEADDLIGIAVDLISDNYKDVVVVTGDKDLWQLITDKVRVYEPINDKYIDVEAAKEHFGVGCNLIPSMKALTGDSDNIPGAPGIGPKIATQLLQKAGSLGRMFEMLEGDASVFKDIKSFGKVKQKALLEAKEKVRLFLQLTAIMSWGDLNTAERDSLWSQLTGEIKKSDFKGFLVELEKLEFNSIISDSNLVSTFERNYHISGFSGRPDANVITPKIDSPQSMLNVIDNRPACYDLARNCPDCQEAVKRHVPESSTLTWDRVCVIGQAWRAQKWLPGPSVAVVQQSLNTANLGGHAEEFLLLRKSVLECQKCTLRAECKGPVFSDGMPGARVMVIARNPGATEDGNGIPLSGKAGKRFNQLLDGQDSNGAPIIEGGRPLNKIIDRNKCYITNTAKCYSLANRPPEDAEILACTPYLREEIRIVQPDLILTLGAEAMQAITGSDFSIMQAAGSILKGSDCAGNVQHTISSGEKTYDPVIPKDCAVLIGNHPAHALRTLSANQKFVEVTKIFAKLVRQAGLGE